MQRQAIHPSMNPQGGLNLLNSGVCGVLLVMADQVDVTAPKISLCGIYHQTGPFQGHPFLQNRITKYVAIGLLFNVRSWLELWGNYGVVFLLANQMNVALSSGGVE